MAQSTPQQENLPFQIPKRRRKRVRWYQGYRFVLATLAMLAAYALLLPGKNYPTPGQWMLIALFYLLAIVWAGNVLVDGNKSDGFKGLAAFGLVFVTVWLFYLYSGAQWSNLASAFFNRDIMDGEWPGLFMGLGITFEIAFFAAIFGTLIGLFLAVFRSFNNPVLNLFIVAYVDFFRAMPIIVLMVLIYYALPYVGITLESVVVGIVALSLNSAAYVSEIFRAGIESVHHGQVEAARALGLRPLQAMRLVILPQAFRVVVPPLTSNYVAMTKDTSICSAIAILELLKTALQIQAWKANPTPLIAATVIYIIFLVPLTRLSGILENRMKTRR